jgi:hypothetical protein
VVLRLRQFSVDVLIGAATMAVAFAAIASMVDVLYLLLISGALVGIGLMLEPTVKEQPAGDIGPQPLQLFAEPKPARPERQAIARFNAPTIDATSAI